MLDINYKNLSFYFFPSAFQAQHKLLCKKGLLNLFISFFPFFLNFANMENFSICLALNIRSFVFVIVVAAKNSFILSFDLSFLCDRMHRSACNSCRRKNIKSTKKGFWLLFNLL